MGIEISARRHALNRGRMRSREAEVAGGKSWLVPYIYITIRIFAHKINIKIISGIAGLVVLAIIGIVVGVVVSKSHKSSGTGTSSSGDKSHPSSSSLFSKNPNANVTGNYFNVVPWNDNNDPSSFQKDDNMKNAFWAVAYTPFGSQIPDCGSNLGAKNIFSFKSR
jgi:hypothetical protein